MFDDRQIRPESRQRVLSLGEHLRRGLVARQAHVSCWPLAGTPKGLSFSEMISPGENVVDARQRRTLNSRLTARAYVLCVLGWTSGIFSMEMRFPLACERILVARTFDPRAAVVPYSIAHRVAQAHDPGSRSNVSNIRGEIMPSLGCQLAGLRARILCGRCQFEVKNNHTKRPARHLSLQE